MERIIKFRAWDKGDKEMIDWDAIFSHCATAFCVFNRPNQYIPMQFTGLKDKNDKEIYEGDIVCADWNDTRYEPQNFKVEWEPIMAAFLFPGGCAKDDAQNYFEVIGNIYESPELLTPPQQVNH